MQSLYCVAQEGMGSCSRLLASTFPSPPEGGDGMYSTVSSYFIKKKLIKTQNFLLYQQKNITKDTKLCSLTAKLH